MISNQKHIQIPLINTFKFQTGTDLLCLELQYYSGKTTKLFKGSVDKQNIYTDQIVNIKIIAPGIQQKDIQELARIFPHIKHLNLDKCQLKDKYIDLLEKFQDLESISLGQNQLSNQGVDLLTKNRNIKELNLNKNNIDIKGTWIIGSRLSDLVYLDLCTKLVYQANNNIYSQGVHVIAFNCKYLQYLNLNSNLIRNDGAQSIAKNLHNLKHLYLSQNYIDDEGTKHLATNLKKIQSLSVANNLITNAGAKFLAINKKHIPMLNINCYTISEQIMKYIQILRDSVNLFD